MAKITTAMQDTLEMTAAKMNRVIYARKGESDHLCPVCLESVRNRNCAYMPCGHHMHKRCFLSWVDLGSSDVGNCATCRRDLRPSLPRSLLSKVEAANARNDAERDAEARADAFEHFLLGEEGDNDTVETTSGHGIGIEPLIQFIRRSWAERRQVQQLRGQIDSDPIESIRTLFEDEDEPDQDSETYALSRVYSVDRRDWSADPGPWEIATIAGPVTVEIQWDVREESNLAYDSGEEDQLNIDDVAQMD